MQRYHARLHRPLRLPQGVLKVKQGYNPNSSSIGTVVYAFSYAVIILSVLAAIIGVFLGRGRKGGR